jgi:hypothetical protein
VLLISTLVWISFGIKYIGYFKQHTEEYRDDIDIHDFSLHMNAVLEHIVCEGLFDSYESYKAEYYTCSNTTFSSFVGTYVLGFVLWPISWVIFALGVIFILCKDRYTT